MFLHYIPNKVLLNYSPIPDFKHTWKSVSLDALSEAKVKLYVFD